MFEDFGLGNIADPGIGITGAAPISQGGKSKYENNKPKIELVEEQEQEELPGVREIS